MGFDVDFTDLEEIQVRSRDPNLFYDPVTGYNIDPAKSGRPNPAYGQNQWMESDGKTQTPTALELVHPPVQPQLPGGRHLHQDALDEGQHDRASAIQPNNQFNLDADWAQSTDFQRDTFRANGIVKLPWDFTLAASYFYGSGATTTPTSSTTPFSKPGTNRLNIGAPITIPAAVLDRWEGPPSSPPAPRGRATPCGAAAAQGGHARVQAHQARRRR